MAIWGEVSYKVKRAITFHKRFSVAELVDATDLSYGQVEQVVQRLIKQDYVRSLEAHELNPAEQAVAQRVGRPRKRYTLIEDPVKREEFYAGVEAIASAERLSRAKERKPSTPYFNRAMQMIEAMERGTEPLSATRLEEATSFLAYGRDFEGLIPEGAEIVQAYYDLAQARLEALQGNYPQAEELLAQAEEAFQTAGLDEQVQRSIDLRLTFRATQGFVEVVNRIKQQADPTPALEALKHLIYDFPSPSYLLLPLQQAIEAVSTALWATMRDLQIAIRANIIANQQNIQKLHRGAQAIERWGEEVEIVKELEEVHVTGLYPPKGMEPLPMELIAALPKGTEPLPMELILTLPEEKGICTSR